MLNDTDLFPGTKDSLSNWMAKYICPDDWFYICDEIDKAMADKKVLDIKFRVFGKNRSLRWIHSKVIPILNDHGELLEWIGASNDITLETEYELNLIAREKDYLEILDGSSLGSIIIDFNEQDCTISDKWRKRLGLREIKGGEVLKDLWGIIHAEDRESTVLGWSEAIQGKNPLFTGEYRIKTIDADYIWVLVKAKIAYDHEGKPIKLYSSYIDINDIKQAEKALRESERKGQDLIAKLSRVDAQRSDYISILSHELRNPLASISGGLALMEHLTPGSESDRRIRGIIQRQTSQLTHLVGDLLDVARLEKNKLKLMREDIEINGLIRESLADYEARFEEKGITLLGEYSVDQIHSIADPVRIKQVIGNLLANALKFTEQDGCVRLTVSLDEDANQVIIQVADNGIGIDPELIPDLFEPFVQADDSLARSAGGLGMGLSIVKGVIDLHGGSSTVKSEGIGKGTEFTIRFPLG